MKYVKNVPLPVSGLILALFSLGNLLQDQNPDVKYLFGTLGAILLVLLVLKIIKYPDDVKNDFKNPVIASSFGTFSMSLMLLSTYLYHWIYTKYFIHYMDNRIGVAYSVNDLLYISFYHT